MRLKYQKACPKSLLQHVTSINELNFFHGLLLSLGMLEAPYIEQMLILCMVGPFHAQGTEKLKFSQQSVVKTESLGVN